MSEFDKKISALALADQLTGDEMVDVVQGGINKKVAARRFFGKQGPVGPQGTFVPPAYPTDAALDPVPGVADRLTFRATEPGVYVNKGNLEVTETELGGNVFVLISWDGAQWVKENVVSRESLKGDRPAHQWDGTVLKIEQQDGTFDAGVDLKGTKGESGNTLYTYPVTSAPSSNPFEGITFKDGEWANYPKNNSRWMVQYIDGAWNFADEYDTKNFVNTLDFISVPFAEALNVDVTNDNKHKTTITDDCTISIINSQSGNIGQLLIQNALYSTVTLTGISLNTPKKSQKDLLEWENINGVIHWRFSNASDVEDSYTMTGQSRGWLDAPKPKTGIDISSGVFDFVQYVGWYFKKIKVYPGVPIIITGGGVVNIKAYDKNDVELADMSGYINNFIRGRLEVPPEGTAYLKGVVTSGYPTTHYIDRMAIFYGHRDYMQYKVTNALPVPANGSVDVFTNNVTGVDPELFCLVKQLNLPGIYVEAVITATDYLRITAYNRTGANINIPADTIISVKFLHDVSD